MCACVLCYSLEELALGSTGITHNAHIDVASEVDTLGCGLVHTTEKHKQNA